MPRLSGVSNTSPLTVYAVVAGSHADDQPLRFPGQQVTYSTAAGEENYNIFRWHRSGWGRYTQEDPFEQPGKEYAYALGNPILYTDALGLKPRAVSSRNRRRL